jgi:hypothetical protein
MIGSEMKKAVSGFNLKRLYNTKIAKDNVDGVT